MVTLDECGWLGSSATVAHRPVCDDLLEHTFLLDMRGAEQSGWIVLPDASAHVIIAIERTRSGRSVTAPWVVGPRRSAVRVDVTRREWTVGVRLRPGALPVLTELPASDFTDRAVPAVDVWGATGRALHDEVGACDDPVAIVRAVTAFLHRRASAGPGERDWRARSLTDAVQSSNGRTAVGGASDRLGISARSLRTVSSSLIGVAPKRFARIERLFQAIRLRTRFPDVAWARVAVAAGYTDQAHLTRDFRDLLGETPARFGARAAREADSYKPAIG